MLLVSLAASALFRPGEVMVDTDGHRIRPVRLGPFREVLPRRALADGLVLP